MNISKHIYGVFAFTAIALAGCSSEDKISPDSGEENGGTRSYLCVKLSQIGGSATSRAERDDYDCSQNSGEVAVSDARFYFFNSDGGAVTVGATGNYIDKTDLSASDVTSGTSADKNPNVQAETGTILVLQVDEGGDRLSLPAKMVTVVNCAKTGMSSVLGDGSLSLADLTLRTAGASKLMVTDAGTKYFSMATSVYSDEAANPSVVNYTALTNGNLCTSEDGAEKNPVTVYVERALAKVTLGSLVSGTSLKVNEKEQKAVADGVFPVLDSKGNKVTLSDGSTQLYVKLLGFNVTANIDKSYVVKKINTAWNLTTNWGDDSPWNYKTYFRSFWAQNPSGATVALPSYTATTNGNTEETTKSNGGYLFFKDCKSFTEAAYPMENAGRDGEGKDGSDAQLTKVIVPAQLGTLNDDGAFVPKDIYKYAGVYYDGIAYLLKGLGAKYVKSGDNTTEVTDDNTTDHYTLKSAYQKAKESTDANAINSYYSGTGRYKSYLTLPSGTFYSDNEGKTEVTTCSGNDDDAIEVFHFNEGQTYYYFPIQHLGYGMSNISFGKYGVVRNHVYLCEITGIAGTGTPVPDKSDDSPPIVPEKPSDGVYMKAQIKILSWRVVKNQVQL